MGGGDSPVLAYDRHVIGRALDYLSRAHEKPQFLVVGTYAPHCTFVAPPKLYRRYRGWVGLPASLELGIDGDRSLYADRQRESEEAIRKGADRRDRPVVSESLFTDGERAEHELIMRWGAAMGFDPRCDSDYVPVSEQARSATVEP